MLAGLAMMLRVVITPNSAFAEIRDNADRYFPWSLGIIVFLSILFAVIEPAALSSEYQLIIAAGMATGIAVSILGSFVSTAVIYLLGRLFGGNKNWKQVFSAIFYAQIIAIPAYVVIALGELTFSTTYGLPWELVLVLALIVWAVIVVIKAVKVVNGFGTAKAFGLIVLAAVITLIMYAPLIGIFYYQDIIAALR